LFFGVISDNAIGLAAVLEKDHRRDRADLETARGYGIRVNIELGDLYVLALLVRDLFEDGSDHTAGTAPGRPEIDEVPSLRSDDLRREVLAAYCLSVGSATPPVTPLP